MATELLYVRKNKPDGILQNLDDVVLLTDVTTDQEIVIPRGARGTVVGVWKEDAMFKVEFSDPPGALATVAAANLQRFSQRTP